MEWQGVNLTNYHQKNWIHKIRKYVILYFVFIVVMLLIAILLHFYTFDIKQKSDVYLTQNKALKNNISVKNKRLEKFILKQRNKSNFIHPQYIELILAEIPKLPIKGIITEITIKHHINDYFELLGKTENQQDFDKLSEYLNRLKQHRVSINMLQTNSNNQLEFMIKVQKE